MKRINVKKLLLSVLGLTMVAVLTVAGTYAYLQSETPEVVNTFKANGVTVTLTETTGETYDIIPGTTVSKDPTVTVENTVDAWVFVEIKDKADGLVTYGIADGWTALNEKTYPGVYYRTVLANAEDNTFSVLKNDEVTYDASLTNDDMLENGELKEGLNLTFFASAIQMDGFGTAAAAWKQVPRQATTLAELRDLTSTSKPHTIALADDVKYDSTEKKLTVSRTATLDLKEGKTITFSAPAAEKTNFAALFVNSAKGKLTVNGDGVIDAMDASYCFHLSGGKLSKPTLIINGGTYKTNVTVVNVQYGTAYINGGFFDCTNPQYTLNCIDANYPKYASIVVKGGTFVNFDPSNCTAEGEGTNFVAEGYTVVSELQENGDTWYTVVKDTTTP